METSTYNAAVYTDFEGLARLKTEASQQSSGARSEVAQQFEALFIQTMLKSMRAATPGDSLTSNDQMKMYQDMMDKQMALDMSKGRGIGIADIIERQLSPQGTTRKQETGDTPEQQALSFASSLWRSQTIPTSIPAIDSATQVAVEQGSLWDSPEHFVSSLMPAARKAARELGTEPEAVLAIAALETGWGKHVIPGENGISSYNLFGIKATDKTSNEQVNITTLEYRNGAMEKVKQPFRTYSSAMSSVADFSSFLRENPRYESVLRDSSNPEEFLEGIHKAGYATDPDYTSKAVAVLSKIQSMGRSSITIADNTL